MLNGVPDFIQGFGRLDLANSAYLASYAYPNQGIVVQDGSITQAGSVVRFCVAVQSTSTLKATMVYMDKEGNPASGIQLMNDLDLVIINSLGQAWRTNTDVTGGFDSLNNVEQITIPNMPTGNYAIYVYGRNLPYKDQYFAVAVSGAILPADCFAFDGASPICPIQCSDQGTCGSDSTCTCSTGRTGVDCSLIPCPSTGGSICSGNGFCNFAMGTCACSGGFVGSACDQTVSVGTSTGQLTNITIVQKTGGLSKGLLAGTVIAAFFVGAIFSIFLGGFLAVKYLEYRRDKAQRDRMTKEEEMR